MATAVEIEMSTLAPIAQEVKERLPELFRLATIRQDEAVNDDEIERWGKVRDASITLLGLLNSAVI